MNKKWFNSIYIIQLIFDLIILLCLLLIFLKLQYKYFYPIKLEYVPTIKSIIESHYKAIFLLLFSWIIIADYTKLYQLKRFNYLREILRKISFQTFFFSIIIFTVSGLKTEELFIYKLVISLSLIIFCYLFITRCITFFISRRRFEKGKDLKKIMIVGENINSKRLKNILITRKHFGLKVIESSSVITFEEFRLIVEHNDIKEVYISQSGSIDTTLENKILNFCEDNHLGVNYIPYSLNSDLISLDVNYIDTLPIFKIKKYPLEGINNQLLKSLFDILFSSLICVFIMSWLFPIIALLIKMDSKGSVIFKQKRRGLNGKEFACYKFRTMRNDGTNSIKVTVVNDNRITKIGNFLRKSSLDELPQFLNVLKGDMSIVGPRPHMIFQDKYYSEIIKKYNLRNYVKPGITGLSQVKGHRGAIDSDKDMEDRINTDIFYVRNWSIFLDIQIIYQTIVLIFKGDENAI